MINRLRAIRASLTRLLLALLSFVLVVLLTIILLAPSSISDFITGMPIWVRLLLVAAIYALAFFSVYQGIKSHEKNQLKGLIVRSPGGSLTSITPESAKERLTDTLQKIEEVNRVTADVISKHGRAQVILQVAVKSDQAHLPQVEKEVSRAVEHVLRKELGVRLADRPMIQMSLEDATTPAPVVVPPPVVVAPPVEPEPEPEKQPEPKVEVEPEPVAPVQPEKPITEKPTTPVSDKTLIDEAEDDDERELWSLLTSENPPDEENKTTE